MIHNTPYTDHLRCGVCGGETFSNNTVLWPSLKDEWQLSAEEAEYIDRQQGQICCSCGSNLRSIALANAIRACLGTSALLQEAVVDSTYEDLRILEINQAGSLSATLSQLPGHLLVSYPEVDMHVMPYPSATFDIVIHSDTLEHVPNPVHALEECRRILKPTGALCFTVPTVVGRLTRSRSGRPRSFHGDPKLNADDYLVHTEYGADAWTHIMAAGFAAVTIHAVAFPAAVAYIARIGR